MLRISVTESVRFLHGINKIVEEVKMEIVLMMLLSIGIKGISAIVEILIQMTITNSIGVSEYGNYTFYVSLIEGAYFLLFSGSIKMNAFYLSSPELNLKKFKKKYLLLYVLPVITTIEFIFLFMGYVLGVIAGIILLIYYFAFDTSSTFFARGKQIPALFGEYLFGRISFLIGLVVIIKIDIMSSVILLAFYGIQFITMLLWFTPHKRKLRNGSNDVDVDLQKLFKYQLSDIAWAFINFSPTVMQYIFGSAFTAGFLGIITIVRRFINFISGPTAKIFLPEFSRLYKSHEYEKLEKTFLMIVRIQMIFIGTIGVSLIGFPSLILKLFSPELIQYSNIFTGVASTLLLIAGVGPVNGMMQMTGNEAICNRNQWISIGVMMVMICICHNKSLFALYGLCVQAIVECSLNYYTICRWFGKNVVPILDYFLLWIPVILIRVVVDINEWNSSILALILGMGIVLSWNVLFSIKDPMIRSTLIKIIRK